MYLFEFATSKGQELDNMVQASSSTVIENGVCVRVRGVRHEKLLSVPVCLKFEPVRVSTSIKMCVCLRVCVRVGGCMCMCVCVCACE